jgi:hypothetical protein
VADKEQRISINIVNMENIEERRVFIETRLKNNRDARCDGMCLRVVEETGLMSQQDNADDCLLALRG